MAEEVQGQVLCLRPQTSDISKWEFLEVEDGRVIPGEGNLLFSTSGTGPQTLRCFASRLTSEDRLLQLVIGPELFGLAACPIAASITLSHLSS